eukprot:3281052-Rhodomonas_salina.1
MAEGPHEVPDEGVDRPGTAQLSVPITCTTARDVTTETSDSQCGLAVRTRSSDLRDLVVVDVEHLERHQLPDLLHAPTATLSSVPRIPTATLSS